MYHSWPVDEIYIGGCMELLQSLKNVIQAINLKITSAVSYLSHISGAKYKFRFCKERIFWKELAGQQGSIAAEMRTIVLQML